MKTKTFLLCALTFIMAQTANAQIWVGGALGADYSNSDKEEKVTNITFSPTVGYQLNDKFDIGLELGYGRTVDKTEQETATTASIGNLYRKSVTNSLSVEPFVRYSFLKSGIVTFFVDGTVGFGYAKGDVDYSYDVHGVSIIDPDQSTAYTTESKRTSFLVGIRPGIKIELTGHLELESHLGFLGYTHSKNEATTKVGSATQNNDYATDKIGFNANSTALNIGLIWKF